MTWKHMKANGGMGHPEQWIKRVGNAPACSLRRDHDGGGWQASILYLSGISAAIHLFGANPVLALEEAQGYCEAQMREAGWVVP
jgi:hypothetical protein